MKSILTLAFLALVILLIINITPIMQKVLPLSFSESIAYYGTSYGVDPALIAAVIQVESSFRPGVFSKKGAVGLMQLMPETAAWLAERKGDALSSGDLLKPEINIELGTYYLKYLIELFPTEHAALAAYNGGPTNCRRWLDEGLWDGSYRMTDQIPFAETRHYVRKVGVLRHLYRFVYQDELKY